MQFKITEIRVYWEAVRHVAREHWACRMTFADGTTTRHPLAADRDDLEGAIEEACRRCDVELVIDDFACDPTTDGGYAIWVPDDIIDERDE